MATSLENIQESKEHVRGSYGLEMELVLLGLNLSDFGEPLLDGGSELGVLGPEQGKVVGEGLVSLLQESAGLLGGNSSGVLLGLGCVDLKAEVPDDGISPLRHRRGVVGEEPELLLGKEERHD